MKKRILICCTNVQKSKSMLERVKRETKIKRIFNFQQIFEANYKRVTKRSIADLKSFNNFEEFYKKQMKANDILNDSMNQMLFRFSQNENFVAEMNHLCLYKQSRFKFSSMLQNASHVIPMKNDPVYKPIDFKVFDPKFIYMLDHRDTRRCIQKKLTILNPLMTSHFNSEFDKLCT